ncbi:hypothetical protein GOALK_050_00580 [Gordonia alkanivorans NBRC 16433]|uniref:N-acetyltransferase domain-containing protein n=1 Tax=Gordonia alkanivorans NBRC 16433 TaxID=1027371 RepID=F9VUB5_9ACTN|nr:hypothetical protein GOALK_050_00580 [Gordonia alkanivorans NBRC 16433]
MNEHDSISNTRLLTADERAEALDLLETGLWEVPMYRWLLGPSAESDAYRWFGEVLFADHLPGLHGRFSETGDLLGLVATAEPNHSTQPVDQDLTARTRHFVTTLDGFVERFTELREKSRESMLTGTVRLVFGLVHPDHRRRRVLSDLLRPIVDQTGRRGLSATLGTADPQLREFFCRRSWGGEVYGEFSLTDGPTVWLVRIGPPTNDQH